MSGININSIMSRAIAAAAFASVIFSAAGASAEPLSYAVPFNRQNPVFEQVKPRQALPQDTPYATEAAARWRRQVVDFPSHEATGSIIIETRNTYLYYVLGNGKAIRYGIGVGREGFTWSGTQTISRKAEWPDWSPPPEMIARQPYLPRFMAGGPGNPLGARAMYLGGTVFRIHGTNDPTTIGGHVSSGCIRMTNEDVIDLYGRVNLGTKVTVL